MKTLALSKELLREVLGGNGGGIEPPTLSTRGAGSGDGVVPPKANYTLTRAEIAKVAGGNGGGGGGIQPPIAKSASTSSNRNGGGGGGVIPPAP